MNIESDLLRIQFSDIGFPEKVFRTLTQNEDINSFVCRTQSGRETIEAICLEGGILDRPWTISLSLNPIDKLLYIVRHSGLHSGTVEFTQHSTPVPLR